MRRMLSANRLVLALCVNAVLLLLILLAMTGRGWPGSMAMGQFQALSAPGAGGAFDGDAGAAGS